MSNTMVNVPTDDGVAGRVLHASRRRRPVPRGAALHGRLRPAPAPLRDGRPDRRARLRGARAESALPRGRAPLVGPVGDDGPGEARRRSSARSCPSSRRWTRPRSSATPRAYLDFLDGQEGVAAGPDAVVGYCMGGTNGFKAIEAFPERLAALASFHGARLATDQPDSPHLQVGRITGEVYFAHADNDSLDAAGVRSTCWKRPSTRPTCASAPRSTAVPSTASRWPTPPLTTPRPRSGTGRSSSRCSAAPFS